MQKSIIIFMLVDPETRAKAKDLINKDTQEIPFVFGLDTAEEVQALLVEIKPLQYVALARAISPIIETATSQPSEKVSSFDELYSHTYVRFCEAIKQERGSEEYDEAAQYPRIVSTLDPGRYDDLELQLMGGAGTAASTMLGILERLPDIITHHKPNSTADTETLETVARNSSRLAWRHAMMSTDQMMALRDVVPYNWFEKEDKDTFTEHLDTFVVVSDSDGSVQSVSFKDLENIVLPEGYIYRGDNPLDRDTSLKEFKLHDRPVIGCPITLLSGSMEKLWQWHIQAVVDNELWEK